MTEENRYTAELNDRQAEAVLHGDGPLLILAGAGSGKTRVLVHRIARLIGEGKTAPGNILAITFTNKAANEMRERIDRMVGFGAGEIWVMTFHALCVRILRRHAELLGYTRWFSIYDADDQQKVMKEVCRSLGIDTKEIRERSILNAISGAKDELIDAKRYEEEADGGFEETVAKAYKKYNETLLANNAMDFDDLLMRCVQLLSDYPEVLSFYQEKFRYIHVDEYQDTNTAQFRLVSLLADRYGNLCVVGDDDQSIYRFRGANIRNILNFEKHFPKAKVVYLEQNYRSTQTILDCANAVIAHNTARKPKSLWTENPVGDRVRFLTFPGPYDEAQFVADDIARKIRREGAKLSDFAVLYRTNAQSRIFEEKFIYENVPYKVVGGINFYARMEIKDVLAYLKTIDNARDDLSVRRIINVPRRGIGAATINKAAAYAQDGGISLYEALADPAALGIKGKAAEKLREFTALIEDLRERAKTEPVHALITALLEKTGYVAELEKEGDEESAERLENLDELVSKAAIYDESASAEAPSLGGFLQEVALVADIDDVEEGTERVLIMTLHASKGLEFENVYIGGLEEGIFPGERSVQSFDNADMDEERRLMYVGITRAKRCLTLTAASRRMIRGSWETMAVSRFVRELPRDKVDLRDADLPPRTSGRELFADTGFGRAGDALRNALNRKAERHEVYGQPAGTNPYAKEKKQFAVKGKQRPAYDVGDRVRSARHGEGTVLDITEGGRDYEVTVAFDTAGTRKLFASFGSLEKI